MLIWMCALHCEAKPVIDFYRLKKSSGKNDFDIYLKQHMACIVSGIGSRKMTQAIHRAGSLFAQRGCITWINLGIAGDLNLAVGTVVLASRVKQVNTPDWLETRCAIEHTFESRPVTSVGAENTDYDASTLFDMEAHAFIEGASLYSPLQQCQSIKIISDNRNTAPDRNKARISRLIADHMQSIADYAEKLQQST